MAKAAVVMVPDVTQHSMDEWIWADGADQSGVLEVKGIPPGRYVVCALVSVRKQALADLGLPL